MAAEPRDLSAYLDPSGNIAVDVEVCGGPLGSGDLEPYVTAVSGLPPVVAGFLRELADDVENAAKGKS